MTAQEFLHDHWFIASKYIAERAGISNGTIRHYYCGSKTPSEKQFHKIKQAVKEIAVELYMKNYEL